MLQFCLPVEIFHPDQSLPGRLVSRKDAKMQWKDRRFWFSEFHLCALAPLCAVKIRLLSDPPASTARNSHGTVPFGGGDFSEIPTSKNGFSIVLR